MGKSLIRPSTSSLHRSCSELREALLSAVDGNRKCIAFPEQSAYKAANVGCNLEIAVKPIAIAFPKTVGQVQELVMVAGSYGLSVQARSGGHSYGNYGLGGVDGAVVIDLKHFQYVSVDHETWIATIGGGTRLEEVTKQLYTSGKRAMPHGTCPSVGIGGHATIGGLGPTSRMWGATLDHIVDMKVVLADGRMVTASATQNPDLHFAMRGAAASFGIVVEFRFRTRPAPKEAVQFSYMLSGSYSSMVDSFKDWQAIATEPSLSRKLFSQVIITTLGMNITGAYFGSEEEFRHEPFAQRFIYAKPKRPSLRRASSSGSIRRLFQNKRSSSPKREPQVKISVQIFKDNWLGLVREWAGGRLLSKILGRPSHFYHKSLTIQEGQTMDVESIEKLFFHLDTAKKGTPMWFVIFDLAGGAINDVPHDQAAFPHRAASIYCQSYAISLGRVGEGSKDFIRTVNSTVQAGLACSGDIGIYPGYVDPELKCGQRQYWGSNVEKLELVKARYDPGDVFRNPQSVRLPRAES